MRKFFKLCVGEVLHCFAWVLIVGSYNLLQVLGRIEQAIRRTVARFKRK